MKEIKKVIQSSNPKNPYSDKMKGWENKTLGDVCVSASSNVSQNKLADDEGDYPIFGASGLIKKVSFYHRDKPYLSIVKDGSGVGRITKMDAFTSVIGTLQYILPKENIDLDYLNYSLMSVDFKKYVAGAAIPHIYFKDYKNEPFLWMPLPEQQRIVSILDEAFSAIERSRNNAEQNLKNAKELFESYLQGVFENGSENWKNKTLGELCTFTQGIQRGVKLQSETQANGQVRFLRIVDYTQGNEPPRYIDHPGDKYILNEEDVALVRYGASTGFVCHGMEGALANNLFRVIPKSFEELSNRFLAVYLKSPIFQDVIKSTMNGAAMPAISFGLIKEIPFPLPNLEEQQTIIQKLTAVQAETQKLEAVYQKKLDDLEELKKSVLQKAFAGEL